MRRLAVIICFVFMWTGNLSARDGRVACFGTQSRAHSFIGHNHGLYFQISEIKDFTPGGNGIVSGNPKGPSAEKKWHRKLSVKTNVLGLGLAIANAAVEIDLCKHLSFNLPVYYSSWDYFTPTVKFRTLAFQPEIRCWFSGRKPCNDGWYLGAHFGLAWYNVAADGEYRIQDHDGKSPALGGGLAVGYRMPISRNHRWKMELSIGAGAYRLHHDKFRNYPNGLLVNTEKKLYAGIDQAAISFSYAFDLKRKGGER